MDAVFKSEKNLMTLQVPNIDLGNECLSFRLRQADRVMTQIYDHHLAACGIRVTQFSILRILKGMKETTSKKLQDILVIDQSTLSRNLKPLLRDNYIKVRPGQDRREKLLSLSSEGLTLFNQAVDHWADAQELMYKQLGDSTTQQLLDLSKIIVALKR